MKCPVSLWGQTSVFCQSVMYSAHLNPPLGVQVEASWQTSVVCQSLLHSALLKHPPTGIQVELQASYVVAGLENVQSRLSCCQNPSIQACFWKCKPSCKFHIKQCVGPHCVTCTLGRGKETFILPRPFTPSIRWRLHRRHEAAVMYMMMPTLASYLYHII